MIQPERTIQEIFNSYFPYSNIKRSHIKIKNNIISIDDSRKGKIVKTLDDYIQKKVNLDIPNNLTFYHFIEEQYVSSILDNKKIRLYNLNKYLENKEDPSEFSHFIDKMKIAIPNSKTLIDETKDNVFIFSGTLDKTDTRHWKRVKNPICLKFKVNKIESEFGFWDINRVVYEKSLKNLFQLQNELITKFDLYLNLSDWYYLSKYVKKDYYYWEKEVRLCFDNNLLSIHNKLFSYVCHYEILNDGDYDYIEVDLINSVFELAVEQIKSDF